MTSDQAAALAALAGRDLTTDEVVSIDEHLQTGNVSAIAALLSVGRSRIGTVSVGDLASWAAAAGMRSRIEDHAANLASPLRSVALALRDVLIGGASGIRLDLPANAAMLDAWVAAGELTQVHRGALLALASVDDPLSASQVSDALEGL